MTPRVRRTAATAAALALLGLAGACAAGGDDAGSSADSTSGQVPAAGAGSVAEAAPPGDMAYADADTADGAVRSSGGDSGGVAAPASDPGRAPDAQAGPAPGDPRALVKKGNVAYRADDVLAARFEVLKVVVQKHGGEIAEDSTESDDEGVPERALLTLRVPVDAFEEAMEGLDLVKSVDGIDVIDSGSTTTDVSTQVIDTDVRVELQKRSIERISVLLDRATSIRDIVGIERELARREADLGSLQKRQAFLADQTSMSTIAVSIQRPPAEKEETEVEGRDETGFVAGLKSGWSAFRSATTGLLTGLGAVLPFAVLAALVGGPLWVWLRRRPRRPPITL